MNLENKQKIFEIICGDWDYRNIDITNPHLQGIQLVNNKIEISCELFSPDIDDYVSCDGGTINDIKIINDFENLDLENKNEVLDFISDIENLIDWDKVSNDLDSEVEKEKLKLENEEINL